MNRVDERFRCMGCDARVRLESALVPEPELRRTAAAVRAALADADRRLTRFDPGSELSRLNADPREAVPASPLVARLARAALWAGKASGGLVDATLAGEIEAAGYAASRTGLAPAPLADALAAAPPRLLARPRPEPGFARIEVLADGRVVRPPGVRLDSGGLGKGLAADVAAELVPAGVRYAISAGGDLAVGGGDWEVAVTGAATGAEVHRLRVRSGGVATSGIHERLWRREDGTLRPPRARPLDGRAGLDRPRRRDRRRAGRAGGRGARQDRAALRPGRRPPRAAPPRRRAPARGRPRGDRRARPRRAAARRGMSTRDPLDYGWWLASAAG